jgi:hypothetical protein
VRLTVRLIIMTAIALSQISIAERAYAAQIETLLMPGEVSRAHEKQEETCSLCHDRTDRSQQSALCLDCHKDIAADIRGSHGYHGHMLNAGKGECRACHAEHKGRGADIIRFDPAAFDHTLTDFPLKGAHDGVACASCHKANVPYRKTLTGCVNCHKDDDIHQGTLGKLCSDCHDPRAWRENRFDHSKTKFALHGAHLKIACDACHFGPRYKNTPQRCGDCHAPDDVHKGDRGINCGECHTNDDWKSAKFDHFKQTGFALLGAHAVIPCSGCHTAKDYKDKLPKDCFGCHGADDSHAGRFGKKCEDCHGSKKWAPVDYDHEKLWHYALTGAHARIGCHDCHTAPVEKQKLKTGCNDCHAAQDPHAGSLGKHCDDCHVTESWKKGIRFDHDLTTFPLTGMHVLTHCSQCHVSKDFKAASEKCIGCHKPDDVHKGGLGEDCASCHSPNGWRLWDFDHDTKTHFPLTGAHKPLHCADCHRATAGSYKMSMDCIACHQQDDIHAGQFGRHCERCHTTITFKGGHAR